MSNINGNTLSAAFECLRLAAIYRCGHCPPDQACGLFGESFDFSRDECNHTLSLDAAEAILLLRDAVPEMLEQRREIERLRALLPECWDAASAHAVASHKDFKQTHPGKAEWIREALGQ